MKDIVLLSTADWDHPFWTNKQHTAQALVQSGCRVFYIDSLGTRKLRLGQSSDLKRIWQRLRRLFTKPREVQTNLWVWSPCVLPAPKSQILRWINRQLFHIQLKFWLSGLSFNSKPVLWTYNPLTLLYTSTRLYASVVYHCVDNIAEQPGAFAGMIESYEAKLFKAANHVFVTSRALEATARQYRSDVQYHSNVVDYDHFHLATQNVAVPDDLAAIPAPRVGFIGAISSYKVDLQLMYAVASQMPHVSFVFIGAVGEGDPDTNIDELKKLANVHFLGPRKYVELPGYLKGLDVCLIPSMLNEYTKSMFPMKFFEYLAAGKAIIATDIDALRELGDVYYVAKNAPEFCQHINHVLAAKNGQMRERGFALAQENTYLSRTHKMLKSLGLKGTEMKKYHVYGIGNALVDLDFEVCVNTLGRLNIDKGVMTLIDENRHHFLLEELDGIKHLKSCGGSVANTLSTLQRMGSKTFYSCKIGDDAAGNFFFEDIKAQGIDSNLAECERVGMTGKCIVLVTPDADRTMNTYLGATSNFSTAQLSESAMMQSEYLYIEGYLVASPTGCEASIVARKMAEKHGIKTSISLSDPNMVTYFREGLCEIIGDKVDLLFCNADEARLFTQTDDIEAAKERMKRYARTYVITIGKHGALVFDGKSIELVPSYKADVIDTVGAGDVFAGAFLHGIANGCSYKEAADIANYAASKVVSKFGPRLDQNEIEDVKASRALRDKYATS